MKVAKGVAKKTIEPGHPARRHSKIKTKHKTDNTLTNNEKAKSRR